VDRFAERVIRGLHVLHGFGATLILLAMALSGYWTLFFPFLVVVGVWIWWRQRHPSDFRESVR
jgi:hypothetical protein